MENMSQASSTPKSIDVILEEENEDMESEKQSDNSPFDSDEDKDSVSDTTGNKTDLDETSALLDHKGSRDLYPKITQNYRPEPKTDEEIKSSYQSFPLEEPIMEKKVAYDGREVTMVTLVTQTDWDWYEETLQEMAAKKGRNRKSVTMVTSVDKTDLSAPVHSSSARDLTSRGKTDGTLTSLETTSLKSPFSMPYNDEYGIPLLDMSTSDDDSSDDDIPNNKVDDQTLLPSIGPPQILQYIRESEMEDPDMTSGEDREQVDEADFPVDSEGRPVGIYGGVCEFCEKEIKPFPTVEQQQDLPPEELYCCEHYREFVQFATSTAHELEEETQKTNRLINIKPHTHFGSKKARKAAKEKAVQRMRDREMQRKQQEASGLQSFYGGSPSGGESQADVGLGGGGKGGGVSVRAGRDMRGAAPPPMSYKDMVTAPSHSNDRFGGPTQSDGHSGGPTQSYGRSGGPTQSDGHSGGPTQSDGHSGGPTQSYGRSGGPSQSNLRSSGPYQSNLRSSGPYQSNLHSAASQSNTNSVGSRIAAAIQPIEVARQMKTINYQLSSQKCLEEGWTVRAPTPNMEDENMMDIFIPEPLDFTLASSAKIRERQVMRKLYENGKPFLTLFPDGTGTVFYPSGNLAVSINKMSAGQFIYVIHDNNDEARVMGVFEPNGQGCCYHPNGNVRLFFDQLEGIELDAYGRRKKKWTWKDKETHVHAPPFQPICIGLNRSIGLRVMTQEYITVTFMTRNQSCRFNVGARLKLISPESIKPKEISSDMLFMEEKAVAIESILDRVSNLLKFPHSPKIDKILPPLRVTRKMQRVEELRSRQKTKRLFPSQSNLSQGQSSSNTSLPAVVVN